MSTRTGLTPPKSGADVRVGREMGRDWGWVLARTQRAERLIAQPRIMEEVDRAICFVERLCEKNGIDVRDLEPDLEPTPTKARIRIRLNGFPCLACDGVGMVGNHLCSRCGGSGFRTH